MALISDATFAAHVSNAGTLGVIATTNMSVAEVKQAVDLCRSQTSLPFGVNVMLSQVNHKEIITALLALRPQVVILSAGNPKPYIQHFKKANIIVLVVTNSVTLAKHVAQKHADMIIMEGFEAGGHVGEMTTISLIPQVVDTIDNPTIAAGGIVDARTFKAALGLGAVGAQIGTRLIASQECPVHENYKQTLIKAKAHDTTIIGRTLGLPIRCYKNNFTHHMLNLEKQSINKKMWQSLTTAAYQRAIIDGDTDNGMMMMGQNVGLIHKIKPLHDIFKELTNHKE